MSESERVGGQEDDEIRVKVTDRRKFNSHGKRRDDAAPEAEAEPDTAPPPRTAADPAADTKTRPPQSAEQGAGGASEPTSAAGSAGQEAPAGTTGRQEAAAGQVDFQSFVYFLYMSALHELGIPTQEGVEPRPADLERARFFVDVLRLLEVKTKGNLEPGEIKLLEEALYNLRMQYVGISQKPPS